MHKPWKDAPWGCLAPGAALVIIGLIGGARAGDDAEVWGDLLVPVVAFWAGILALAAGGAFLVIGSRR